MTIYRIATERLVLRCWEPTDAPSVLALVDANEAHLASWLPWVAGRPRSVGEQAELLRVFRSNFDRGEEFVFGVFSREGRCLGSVGLHPKVGPHALEIGYWLAADQCGKGLGREMVGAACGAAFHDPSVQRLEIHCAPENQPSWRIAARLGFTHEATLARRLSSSRGVHDLMLWSLWRDQPRPAVEAVSAASFDVLGNPVLGA